jgi:hypothetical protein
MELAAEGKHLFGGAVEKAAAVARAAVPATAEGAVVLKDHERTSYLQYHGFVGTVCVAAVVFLFDGGFGVENADRLFIRNWTWQCLWCVSGTYFALLPWKLEEFGARAGVYVVIGFMLNAYGLFKKGSRIQDNVGDCFFQMWFIVGVLIYAYMTRMLKEVAVTGKLIPGALFPAIVLCCCGAGALVPHGGEYLYKEVLEAGGSGVKFHIGGENPRKGILMPLAASGAVLGVSTLMCAHQPPSTETKSSLGWALLALVYVIRMILPYEHAVAFYLHCFNLFMVAIVVAVRGLSMVEKFKDHAAYVPWVLLFLSTLTQGTVQTPDALPDEYVRRVPFSLTEAVFVVSYFAAAEKDWGDLFVGMDAFQLWALGAFAGHATVWRLLPKPIAALALFVSLVPAFFMYQSRRRDHQGMQVLP